MRKSGNAISGTTQNLIYFLPGGREEAGRLFPRLWTNLDEQGGAGRGRDLHALCIHSVPVRRGCREGHCRHGSDHSQGENSMFWIRIGHGIPIWGFRSMRIRIQAVVDILTLTCSTAGSPDPG